VPGEAAVRLGMATTAPERQDVLMDVIDAALNDIATADITTDGPPN
jgi:hypothetical protein